MAYGKAFLIVVTMLSLMSLSLEGRRLLHTTEETDPSIYSYETLVEPQLNTYYPNYYIPSSLDSTAESTEIHKGKAHTHPHPHPHDHHHKQKHGRPHNPEEKERKEIPHVFPYFVTP
ncbi:hypothetical protein HN51_013612 [Arachis hypogaea]|nr:uncharacterized protein DS421_3g98550 [Arachis hypogaea]